MTACNCMGPQDGEPLCPCQMRAIKIYEFEKYRNLKKINESGLEPDTTYKESCIHPEHNPPTHLHIPGGFQYRHVCPSCDMVQIVRSNNMTMEY